MESYVYSNDLFQMKSLKEQLFFKLAIIVQATKTEKPKILFKDVNLPILLLLYRDYN